MRIGDWKLVAVKNSLWELYKLKKDRAETNNLADIYPDKVMELEKQWNEKLDEIRLVAPQKSKDKKKVSHTIENLK